MGERIAGQELDALVAEKVIGWTCLHPFESWEHEGPDGDRTLRCGLCKSGNLTPPHYSTDIAAAMLVVDRLERPDALRQEGYWLSLKSPFFAGEQWHAGFTPRGMTGWNGRPDHRGSGHSPALAICRAALTCVEAEALAAQGDAPEPEHSAGVE